MCCCCNQLSIGLLFLLNLFFNIFLTASYFLCITPGALSCGYSSASLLLVWYDIYYKAHNHFSIRSDDGVVTNSVISIMALLLLVIVKSYGNDCGCASLIKYRVFKYNTMVHIHFTSYDEGIILSLSFSVLVCAGLCSVNNCIFCGW